MQPGTYNQWYSATYDKILCFCDWGRLDADVEMKVLCVFGWMPLAIMNVTDSGKGRERRTKAAIHHPEALRADLGELAQTGEFFRGRNLDDTDLQDPTLKAQVVGLCGPVFKALGSVAGSKFLHFSYPSFFIMWDRRLRANEKLKDSTEGYLEYLKKAQAALQSQEIRREAEKRYTANPVRGLDVYWMETARSS